MTMEFKSTEEAWHNGFMEGHQAGYQEGLKWGQIYTTGGYIQTLTQQYNHLVAEQEKDAVKPNE